MNQINDSFIPPRTTGKGYRVLIVDDVDSNLMMQNALLKRLGFETLLAKTGNEALAILKETVPHFVMTDLWMSTITGEELAAFIRHDPRLKDVIIIAITADIEAQTNFNLKDFNDILYKPLTVRRFVDLMIPRYIPPPEQ